MKRTVLILGPTGRFGRNAVQQFKAAGWQTRLFNRKTDDLDTAARGVDVIVNAWNLPYSKWSHQVLAMQAGVQRAALDNDATVIIPGNLYVFGPNAPLPWSHTSMHLAENELGRIRIAMERSYADAGVRTIILRAGDFLDTEPSGNWFDRIMAPSLKRGVLTYPGRDFHVDRVWGYLPDVTRAAVLLAEKRDTLDRFVDVSFPGYTLTASQMAAQLSKARGQTIRLRRMHWWPLRLVQPFMADVRHFFEMRYLWDLPHHLDNTRLAELLPGFVPTPECEALKRASAHIPVAREGHAASLKAQA